MEFTGNRTGNFVQATPRTSNLLPSTCICIKHYFIEHALSFPNLIPQGILYLFDMRRRRYEKFFSYRRLHISKKYKMPWVRGWSFPKVDFSIQRYNKLRDTIAERCLTKFTTNHHHYKCYYRI